MTVVLLAVLEKGTRRRQSMKNCTPYIAVLCLSLSACTARHSPEISPEAVTSTAAVSILPSSTANTDVTTVVGTDAETTVESTLPTDTSAFATSIDDNDAQLIALEIYGRLLQSFGTDDTISNRRLDTTLYPDTYAGAYYEDGMLNIYLTDTSEEVTRQYAEITGTDHVRFVKKEFSYTYLTALYDDICLLMPEGTWGIRTVEVSQYENIVKIGVSSEPDVAALSQKLKESGYNDGSFYIYVNNMVINPR
ncbi:MAG: hypothetical protein II714_04040 [Oscillospiraceae bacterium]|nr:hypothetical protein [Oscillospiraceae bacterium]